MKINKIYISAFGGLRDFTLELQDGFNVIYGDNENGKSTVMAFIKAMFYGTGKKTQQLAGSMRQKYTPWNGDTMAGRIYFECGGRNYCLEKEFRKSDSTDRIVLTDLDTGHSENVDSDVGQHFFGVGIDAFERSVFIGNTAAFSGDAANGELNLKLSNLAFTGDEGTSYQTISKRIESAKNKLISKSGKAGSCVDDIRRHNELSDRLTASLQSATKKIELTAELEKLQEEYKRLYGEYQSLSRMLESENDIKNAEKLKEFLEIKSDLDKLNRGLTLQSGGIIDDVFIKKIEFAVNKQEKLNEKINLLNTDIQKIEEAINLQQEGSVEENKQKLCRLTVNLNDLNKSLMLLENEEHTKQTELDECNEQKEVCQNKKRVFHPILFAIAITLFLASGALSLVDIMFSVCVAVPGLLILILAFIIRPLDKRGFINAEQKCLQKLSELTEIKNQIVNLKQQITAVSSEINLISSVLNSDSAARAQRKTELQEKQQLLEEETQKYNSAHSELISFISQYGKFNDTDDIKKLIEELAEKTDKQKQLKLKLAYISRDIGNISYEQAEEKLKALSDKENETDVNFSELKERAKSISELIGGLRDSITAKQTELKTSFRNTDNPEDLRRETEALKEKITEKKAYCDALDIANTVLEESFHEVRRSYGTKLEEKTLEIFSRLTGGRYKNISVSKALDVSVEQTNLFGIHEVDYLSQGTIDQAFLSLRLAISKLISGEESMPIMLDDSLCQYDDNRAQIAIGFLKEFSLNTQIVLFTCHSSIYKAAENCGIITNSAFKN